MAAGGSTSELDVSLNDDQENTLLLNGFKKLPVPLSTTQGGDSVFLWYKEDANPGITRIQFSYTSDMENNLQASGYQKVDKNLNTSGSGDPVYLWFLNGRGQRQVPIQEIDVSIADIPGKIRDGWERQGFNLNRKNGGEHAFLWMKREKITYIHQVLITDSYDYDVTLFKAGYIRVDESTNRSADGKPVFLWYLPSTKAEKPIQGLVLMYDEKRKSEYQSAGVKVLNENLNSGNGSPCF
uniref:Si:dkey-30j10.5 n=1 Tax=Poecilia formosa TaxID=48698 RepID=A0A096MCN3_POEFO